MTVATKDALQDLTAEETTKPFTQSNSLSGEELKMQTGLLEGKEQIYIHIYIWIFSLELKQNPKYLLDLRFLRYRRQPNSTSNCY